MIVCLRVRTHTHTYTVHIHMGGHTWTHAYMEYTTHAYTHVCMCTYSKVVFGISFLAFKFTRCMCDFGYIL